ncbi:MAG: SCO family protein [Alphaproteobacteria bacterium]|nr:SCO family protein [Alphaproteobacteria bacterium]
MNPVVTRLGDVLRAALVAGAIFGAVAAEAGQSWHDGYFPNVVLTDQDGKKVKFYDDVIKGKVVVLSFIYTKCKDVCPVDTAQLRQVHELLGDRVGRDVFFYSISIDPKNDTPAVLKRYMHMFDIGPGWRFLTGNKEDIVTLQRKLGLIGADVPVLKEHNTSVMLGNEATGQWIKRSPYDHPKILANLLTDSLGKYVGGSNKSLQPFSVAAEIKGQTRGDILFRTRCTACHTIGGGDKLGPDLKGVVAARPRDWLTRWLKEPDKMIAEKDPVALALKARYRNLPMPNLGLNDIDAAALIEYLEKEDGAQKSASEARCGGIDRVPGERRRRAKVGV